jgi:hypothetical protein
LSKQEQKGNIAGQFLAYIDWEKDIERRYRVGCRLGRGDKKRHFPTNNFYFLNEVQQFNIYFHAVLLPTSLYINLLVIHQQLIEL